MVKSMCDILLMNTVDKTSGVETSRREGTTTEEGLDITMHSYIYHPNFFRLDFGGGPVFVQHTL